MSMSTLLASCHQQHQHQTSTASPTMKYSTVATDSLQKLVDVATKRWISISCLFDQADVDRSGDVTKEEMKDLLDQMHLSNSVNFDEIWDALDKDKSGEVTREEWDECFSAVAVAVVPSSDSTSNTFVSWRIKPSYRADVPGGLVALVAHNKMKAQMASFVGQNLEFFKHCRIITTGSTGKILEDSLGLCVYQKVTSGPLGGDQEIGALVTRGHVSAIFFFKDPLSAHQHAADIEALTRICDVHNVAYATNSASGKSLVTAMAFLGLGFGSSEESVTVKEYKAEQAQVIRRLSVIR